jgi:aquaporin Z
MARRQEKPSTLKPCLAEFLGTFLLVLTIGCNVLSGNGTWGAVSIACVLMVMIYAFADASGANFNPAVTVALHMVGKVDANERPMTHYFMSQLAGGLCGAGAYRLLFPAGFKLAPAPGRALGALLCEMLYTFMLCYVVLNTAASKKKGGKNQYFGLAIGFVIVAGGYASAAVGAGCFNPAVAFSIWAGAIDEYSNFGWCALYMLFEFLGAALSVYFFKKVRPEDAEDSDAEAPESYDLTSKLMSEAIGTFMLVFTVGNSVLGHSKALAFSVAAALMCMIYATGDVSGGHFNPAVTVAVHLCGKRQWNGSEVCKYVAAQVGGAVLAGIAYALCHSGHTFPLGPGIGHNWAHVAGGEMAFSFVLCLVVLCVAMVDKPAAPDLAGFIIGSCVTAGGLACGGISGGALNPAVAAGIAFVHIMGGGFFWKSIVYTICQLAGAVAAATVFKIIYAEEVGKGKENNKGERERLEEGTKARV